VMKVPIRVYNHVSVGHRPTPYDLLWPISVRKRTNVQPSAKVIELKGTKSAASTTSGQGKHLPGGIPALGLPGEFCTLPGLSLSKAS